MKKTTFLFFVLFLSDAPAFAQKLYKYWLEFQDKANSPYCLCRPAEFLSPRALERRARAGIALVENDLPVNPAYLDAIKQSGASIHNTSRWLNAAAVMADTAVARRLEKLPFVKSIQYLGPHLKYRNPPNRPPKTRAPLSEKPVIFGEGIAPEGYALAQNSMLYTHFLHDAGIRGAGIWIAVMDGGFTNADTIPMFDSAALQGRLHPGWDFVERDAGVFEAAQHGTSVLSVMAANLPKYFVGTAPDATYFLLKTEDTGGEFPIEEANWVAGAEWADSIGCDLLNASLGYTSFNDNTLSHTYKTLDGRTAIASRGAAIAAAKGMIICNAAGNEGDGAWHYIGVPADAPGIVAVGACGTDAYQRASFSSWGPTADGRLKPDLVAPGDQVVVAGNVGISLGLSSGTSLASPMLTGALASLWSAFPEKTAQEILESVYATAYAPQPDNEIGYGLPNMLRAWLRLGKLRPGDGGFYSFDRDAGELAFYFWPSTFQPGDKLELRNGMGQKVSDFTFDILPNRVSRLQIKGLAHLPPGSYQIILQNGREALRLRAAAW